MVAYKFDARLVAPAPYHGPMPANDTAETVNGHSHPFVDSHPGQLDDRTDAQAAPAPATRPAGPAATPAPAGGVSAATEQPSAPPQVELDAPSATIDDNASSWASPLDPRTAPGLIGFATREHEQLRAKRQTPLPGYLAHLLATSTVMGLGFQSTFKDAPDYANLHILALLPSLFGKEDIVKEVTWALNSAHVFGMQLNFSMGYASGPAVHTAFVTNPYQCYLEDEAGRKAQQQRKGGGDPHQPGVVTTFMEMFGRYSVPSRSHSGVRDTKPKVPHAYATYLRLSQPETLTPTLEKVNVKDGQLNRPYFIYEPKLPPKHPYGTRTYQPPSDVLVRAYQLLAHWSRSTNELAVAHAKNEANALRDPSYVWQRLDGLSPIPVVPTPEAEGIYKQFDDWCEKQVQAGFPIWGRAPQNAKRHAMVFAVGEVVLKAAMIPGPTIPDPPDKVYISPETMVWTCAELAGRLRALGLFADEEIHGSDHDGLIAARVLKYLGSKGGTMRASRVIDAVRMNVGMPYDKVRSVVVAMVETEQLIASATVLGNRLPDGTTLTVPHK